jgi:hypothetical protein
MHYRPHLLLGVVVGGLHEIDVDAAVFCFASSAHLVNFVCEWRKLFLLLTHSWTKRRNALLLEAHDYVLRLHYMGTSSLSTFLNGNRIDLQ